MAPTSPPEFLEFTKAFHQDIGIIYASERELVRDAVSALSPAGARRLAAFIRRLLADADDEELDRLWAASKAEVDLPAARLRHLFKLVENETAQAPTG